MKLNYFLHKDTIIKKGKFKSFILQGKGISKTFFQNLVKTNCHTPP